MGLGVQPHASATSTPGEDPVPIFAGGFVGPRAGVDMCGKFSPPPGFDPCTVQPVANRYTD